MNDKELTKSIWDAVKIGDLEKVRLLIGDSKARLQEMTPFGTWLHIAAKAGNMELIQGLLSMGAEVNAKGGTFGGTAINLAASFGQTQAVKALLAAGATLDVSEPERNPLFGAIQEGSLEIVKLLIKHGINHRVSYTGDSMKNMDALAFARAHGQLEIADYLAKLGKKK